MTNKQKHQQQNEMKTKLSNDQKLMMRGIKPERQSTLNIWLNGLCYLLAMYLVIVALGNCCVPLPEKPVGQQAGWIWFPIPTPIPIPIPIWFPS